MQRKKIASVEGTESPFEISFMEDLMEAHNDHDIIQMTSTWYFIFFELTWAVKSQSNSAFADKRVKLR